MGESTWVLVWVGLGLYIIVTTIQFMLGVWITEKILPICKPISKLMKRN